MDFVDKLTEKKNEIEPRFLVPQGASGRSQWDPKALKKLIQVLQLRNFVIFFIGEILSTKHN